MDFYVFLSHTDNENMEIFKGFSEKVLLGYILVFLIKIYKRM